METLKRLTLIATLTGLVSGPWLGVVERPQVAPTPMEMSALLEVPADGMSALGDPAAALTIDVARAAAPVASSSAVVDAEAVPQAAPPRRGGGIGIALKK